MREVIIRRFCAHCYRHGRRTELASGHSEYRIVVNEFGATTDLCDDCAHTVLVPLLEMMSAGEDLTALSRHDWAQLGSVFPRTAAIRKLNGPASIKPAAAQPAAPEPAAPQPASEPAAAQLVLGGTGDIGGTGDAGGGVEPAKAKPPRKTAPDGKTVPGRRTVPGRSKAAADKSHVCQGCGQTFTRAANLAIHVNRFGTQPHRRPTRRGAALIADPAPQDAAPQDGVQQDAAQQDGVQKTASAPAQQAPTAPTSSEDS
ncbi:MAG TPA: hypothetical protein VFC19_53900 [Candidatus Limnocylindrales bacterium]|nr:hypothetical protein [Candidatus Limnocylindrales bacterium]